MSEPVTSAPSDGDSLPIDEARARIAAAIIAITPTETIPLHRALDRVLAAELMSPIDVPAHDNAAMDGFALRSDDLPRDADGATLPVRLDVIGSAFAGRAFEGALGAGQSLRIMTGAVMPDGADTVVTQESVHSDGAAVYLPAGVTPGQHRRLRGEDLARDRPALAAGRRLSPADLGLVASLGIAQLTVRRRLRVAYFSTGNELCPPGLPLPAGQIHDSNRYTILGMLSRLGVDAIDLGIVRDDPDALERAIRDAAGQADAILSSGGVSVGEADFTRTVMARLGNVAFWRIAMRPGRPMAFGRIGDACYFGLPGNPVAVMITFRFLVRDALLAMMGAQAGEQPLLRARSRIGFRKLPGRTEYQRAWVAPGADGVPEVTPIGNQGSGVLRSMAQANCIVVLHHDQGSVAPGAFVDCLSIDGLY